MTTSIDNPAANDTFAHTEAPTEPKARKPRGFAAMDRALVKALASKGGKAAHAAGTAHEFNTTEAQVAGRKGGKAAHEAIKARKAAKAAEKKVA